MVKNLVINGLFMDNKQKYCSLVKELKKEQKKGKKKCVLDSSVFEWVLKNIPSNGKILELGSGRSSGIFSLLYKVDSIEHDYKYVGKHPEVNYIYAPIKEYSKYYWYDTKFLKKFLGKKYDLIIVDGPTSKTGREGFVINYSLFKDYACPILIDETDRLVEKKVLNCFLDSGFEKLVEEKKHVILKPKKISKLKQSAISTMLKNEKLVICFFGDVSLNWLNEKRNFDVCLIHSGKNKEKGQKLKPLVDYFITHNDPLIKNYYEAFKKMPKMKVYEKIIFIDDNCKISANELEKKFQKITPVPNFNNFELICIKNKDLINLLEQWSK